MCNQAHSRPAEPHAAQLAFRSSFQLWLWASEKSGRKPGGRAQSRGSMFGRPWGDTLACSIRDGSSGSGSCTRLCSACMSVISLTERVVLSRWSMKRSDRQRFYRWNEGRSSAVLRWWFTDASQLKVRGAWPFQHAQKSSSTFFWARVFIHLRPAGWRR